ncbi:NAD(P)/FAD-dependent oxidoreductase [Vibrio salinus]|uniref:NAD(P)/FAD-dependent oxidoreductase n=1 Tax=Vibrio salinus TaxID=2899784 RepID=UPI001E29DF2B|nr:FAD/NAD(P)-binding oxidoreductase [Vibrio salinus]MCE0494962.1 NAD(P)/FAD-dependent oxidoreductase [Vibrio salinus]
MESPRIVIIGAGPSGIRCAETLIKNGFKPIVIDEQKKSGGQIYKRQPSQFHRSYQDLYGTEHKKALDVHKTFDNIEDNIEYFPETTVWAIEHNTLYAHQKANPVEIHFDYLILCTGAIDRVLPVKGWEKPGVYSLGGAQIALKHQACSVGGHVAFVGTGPLLYLVAYQYMKAGASVAGVYDTSGLSSRIGALKKLLVKPKALWTGLKMMKALRKAGIPILSNIRPEKICGDDTVSGIEIRDKKGALIHVGCDAVALGFHIKPETQLADLAGCKFSFHDKSALWLPTVDDMGRTSQKHIFSAGDGCKILGADAAEVAGKLTALSVISEINPLSSSQKKQLHKLLVRFRQLKRFGDGLLEAFPWPEELIDELADDTIICRCEMISKAEVALSVKSKEATEVNRSKSFSRVGMGRCQGRYCSHINAHIITGLKHQTLKESGRQRSQAPVKPIPINVYVADAPQDAQL